MNPHPPTSPPVKLAVLADLHFRRDPSPDHRGHIADVLAMQAVRLIKQRLRPHATLIAGDLLDDPDPPDAAADLYRRLDGIFAQLDGPCLILPGNHDLPPDRFYRHLPRPQPVTVLGPLAVVCCFDQPAPDYWATRRPEDLLAFEQARRHHPGSILAFHHVPCLPPDLARSVACPFNLTNAAQALAVLDQHRVGLSVCGHFHDGFDLQEPSRRYIGCPALCRPPFPLLEIVIEPHRCSVLRHHLLDAL